MVENEKENYLKEILPTLLFTRKILSEKDFCEKIGWDAPSLSQMKSGKRPINKKSESPATPHGTFKKSNHLMKS